MATPDMSMGFGANRNPITPHGRVVYNAKPDMVDYRARASAAAKVMLPDHEFMTIKRHEPCLMKMRTKPIRYFNANDLLVTGCTNGIGNDTEKLESAYSGWRFAGIAQSECLYDTQNNWVSDELTVQVGGLTTVYNTGDAIVHAGDFVMWEVFDEKANSDKVYPRVVGQPKNKRLVVLKSLKPILPQETTIDVMQYIMGNEPLPVVLKSNPVLEEMGKKLKAKGDIYAHPTTKEKLDPSIQAALLAEAAVREIKSRVIGTAMSTAEPGKTFDILLGKYAL